MSNKITLGNLFSGSGTWELAAKMCGIDVLLESEIEKFPVALEAKRFPEAIQLGDVTKIDGAKIPPVDIFTNSSPCFPAETMVRTDNGDKPISDVVVGDKVLTHTGQFKEVIDAKMTGHKSVMRITTMDGNVECTENHPFYVKKIRENKFTDFEWVKACELDYDCFLVFPHGIVESEYILSPIQNIEKNVRECDVYNLTVKDDNSYTANGFAVHNCQNLSIAGNREGLVGSESGLFMEAIRITKEMRNETKLEGNIKPRFWFWENVPGAFSSGGKQHKGEDFQRILQEVAKIKDERTNIPLPPEGKWHYSGVVDGDGYQIAWKTLDAQFMGVPQRRRRVFLVADFDGHCAEEILAQSESLSWNFAKIRETWKNTSRTLEERIDEAGRIIRGD